MLPDGCSEMHSPYCYRDAMSSYSAATIHVAERQLTTMHASFIVCQVVHPFHPH